MRGSPVDTVEVLLASLSSGTRKQYNSSLHSWWTFSLSKTFDPYDVNITSVLSYLQNQFEEGMSIA